MTTKVEIWQEWTEHYFDAENPTPLFETGERLTVEYKHYGKDDRRILKRSSEMDSLVRKEWRKIINN